MNYTKLLVAVLRFNTLCWIVSPWIFGGLRMAGVINTGGYDWIIFVALGVCSTVAVFLNFGSK